MKVGAQNLTPSPFVSQCNLCRSRAIQQCEWQIAPRTLKVGAVKVEVLQLKFKACALQLGFSGLGAANSRCEGFLIVGLRPHDCCVAFIHVDITWFPIAHGRGKTCMPNLCLECVAAVFSMLALSQSGSVASARSSYARHS